MIDCMARWRLGSMLELEHRRKARKNASRDGVVTARRQATAREVCIRIPSTQTFAFDLVVDHDTSTLGTH